MLNHLKTFKFYGICHIQKIMLLYISIVQMNAGSMVTVYSVDQGVNILYITDLMLGYTCIKSDCIYFSHPL